MKKIIFYLLVPISLLISCAPQKEVIREFVKNPMNTDNEAGPSDTGGGNGLNGRPLESYRQDMTLRNEYQSLLQILKDIGAKHVRLAGEMHHILRNRNFYFVPVPLNKIPSSVIGVGFAIDQMALQTIRDIWFDETLYPVLEKDQILLLVHELIMGVRLMEFQDDLDQCLAKASGVLFTEKAEEYVKERDKCFEEHIRVGPQKPTKKMRLTDADYAIIRELSSKLVSELKSLTSAELESYLKSLQRIQ